MPRLLVVEDFPALAKSVMRVFRQAGFTVQMAASRAEALHVEGSFDTAIVDLELPDGTGIDVANDLRASGQARRIVFFTACRDPQKLASAAELGQVVDKSAGAAMLLAMITGCFEEGEQRRIAVGDLGGRPRANRGPSQRSGTRRIR